MKIRVVLICILVIMSHLYTQNKGHVNPLAISRKVADKVIRETSFQFDFIPQLPVLGIQVVDFRHLIGLEDKGTAYATSFLFAERDTTVAIGLSSSCDAKIWLNQQIVRQVSGSELARPREIAYNVFVFQDTLRIELKPGFNQILIKILLNGKNGPVYLRLLRESEDQNHCIYFSLKPVNFQSEGFQWMYVGPFSIGHMDALEKIYPPEESFQPYYSFGETNYTWKIPPRSFLAELKITPETSYQRESYLEWHYANGALMMSFIALSEVTGQTSYANFAKEWCNFILTHYDYFEWQYHSLNAFRGSYHRIFRRTMLDDTGAPVLPFVTFAIHDKIPYSDALIKAMTDYILHRQVRMSDGTFCRPEPEKFTVWADDLFMSVPFLLRMGMITRDPLFFDDAARQVIQFNKLLFDSETGLYNHGWFSQTGKTSPIFWGRANGWIVWATAEALTYLPQNHPEYNRILTIFRKHLNGLVKYQGVNGLWHQVLDHPQSYEETSCTAMYIIALAQGVNNGWLEDSYQEYAFKGWEGITSKIRSDGTVERICRGTGIGTSLEFYLNRQTFDHDPRGLGAVITAGIAVHSLFNE